MGYYQAGFDVVGVDIEPCKDYPFEFIKADAMTFPLQGFDAIHASPPCQAYSAMQHIHKNKESHPDLIQGTRDRLSLSGAFYVIENVVGAPLRQDLLLCGTMFGLKIIRHRIFECNFDVPTLLTPCDHRETYDPWHGKSGDRSANKLREAMGIDWMRDAGGGKRKGTLSLAVPPAYTKFVGEHLIKKIK